MKTIKPIQISNKVGLLSTILIAGIVLFFAYGSLLKNINKVYFNDIGDGLQAYYNSVYHIKHDTKQTIFDGQNYPYGETVYFARVHPLISNTIKLLKTIGVDLSDYTVGLLNLYMLISIVLGALFIYLIFTNLKIPAFISCIFSIPIAFLSPQLARFTGHYCLTLVFVIPLSLYLLMLFYKKPTWIKTILIGVFTYWAAITHVYFLGFIGIIQLVFILYRIKKVNKLNKETLTIIIHFIIQLILPYIILQLLILFTYGNVDRTSFPWGFFSYRAYPSNVFLPINQVYGAFIRRIAKINGTWEGVSFIGMASLICSIVIFIIIIKKTIKKNFKQILMITDNELLNVFLWSGIVSLVYSFGVPFVLGLEFLLDYSGPLKQLRAIGRFTWPFYYIINIVTVYLLWKWTSKKRREYYWVLIFIGFLLISYDAFLNVRNRSKSMNHTIIEFNDTENSLPQNKWMNTIIPSDYQAILSLPHFNIGSENFWWEPKCKIMKWTYVVSVKTGLPTISTLLTRTSITQSVNNIELFLEQYRYPIILDSFRNDKPLLVLVDNCNELSEREKQILESSEFISKSVEYSVYKLPLSFFDNCISNKISIVKSEIDSHVFHSYDSIYSTDSIQDFIYKDFNNNMYENSYLGSGAYIGRAQDWNVIFEDSVDFTTDSNYVVSFWFKNIKTDLFPRSNYEITFYDCNNAIISRVYKGVWPDIKIIDKDWGMVERTVLIPERTKFVKIVIWNKELKDKEFIIDELLIRPENTNLYIKYEDLIWKNNRSYLIE